MEHFYNLADLDSSEVRKYLALATLFKAEPLSKDLSGQQFALLFLAPSLRTRSSFEVAIRQMSGGVSTLEPSMFYGLELQDGVVMDGDAAEHIREAVPVLSRFYSGLGLRVMARGESEDEDLTDFRFRTFMNHATVPMFNMESALYHPCQALADLLTIQEVLGEHRGRRITLTWAPHTRSLPTAVPNSLLLAATGMGMKVTLAHPEGFELPEPIMERARDLAREAGGELGVSYDQADAVAHAEIVYAKSWGALTRYEDSDGETELRRANADWIVTDALMRLTANARFMHCLPVRRNVVVADSVIDGPSSVVIQQAENRLHAQKAVLKQLYAPA